MRYLNVLFVPNLRFLFLHEICLTFDAFFKALFWTISPYSKHSWGVSHSMASLTNSVNAIGSGIVH